MVYDFEARQLSQELTLHAIHTYIWSQTLESAKNLCWEVSTEVHEELLRWIDSLPDPDKCLNNFRACLLAFSVTDGRVIPQKF